MLTRVILGLAGSMALASTAQAYVIYQCQPYDGTQITVEIFEEEDVARTTFTQPNGQTSSFDMIPAITGSGFRYTARDGGADFYGRGLDPAIWTNGNIESRCTVSQVIEPGGTQAASGPFSFGGNLRAGPGTNFARVTSVAEGTPVTMIQDSGVYFQGYSFWLIQLPNGTQGYHWGGILCAPGESFQGIFNEGC